VLEWLGCDGGDLVVIPIVIAGQVFSMIACATAAEAPMTRLEACARMATIAFDRLVREAAETPEPTPALRA